MKKIESEIKINFLFDNSRKGAKYTLNGLNWMNHGEFAEIVGLSAPTIRYYENQGLLKARRTDNGRRYFTEQDIKWVKFLLHLKGTGMSINDLKKYVTWRAEGDQTIPDRLDLLKKTKADFMEEYRQVQHHLQILNDKIKDLHTTIHFL